MIRGLNQLRSFVENHPLGNWVSLGWKKYSPALLPVTIVLIIYIWFISAGTWIVWESPTRHYADLARGFRRGHLYLPSKPDPALVALPDPYDHLARAQAGVRAPIDVSYYNGRYYLYWGPVPALLLWVTSPFYYGRIGDLQLVFVFICGTFIIQTLFLVTMRTRFFSLLPEWMLVTVILVAGLGNPATFMLDKTTGARIYEASVVGAQFFLMAGFLAIFSAQGGSFYAGKFLLAGICWALSVGTRQTVMLAVGAMMLLSVISIWQSKQTLLQKMGNIFTLVFPLGVGAVLLGWYNWARFGSITETGLYYQMNHGFVHYHTDKLMGYRYIFQNIYNYLLMPFNINSEFPFLHPILGSREEIFFFSEIRSIYGSQVITGLLYAIPFIIFCLVPILIQTFGKKGAAERGWFIIGWAVATLGAAALASFAFLSLFFWAAMRYEYDFLPSLILLSAIGFWQGYSILSERPVVRRIYAGVGVLLAATSIIVSTLLALSVNDARFILIRWFSL